MTHQEKLAFHNAIAGYATAVHEHYKKCVKAYDMFPEEVKDIDDNKAKDVLNALPYFDVDEAGKDVEKWKQHFFS